MQEALNTPAIPFSITVHELMMINRTIQMQLEVFCFGLLALAAIVVAATQRLILF